MANISEDADQDSPSIIIATLESELHDAVAKMGRRFKLDAPTEKLVCRIKETMSYKLADGRSVRLRLALNWRNEIFNKQAARVFPNVWDQFKETLAPYAARNGKKASKRQEQRFVDNLWKRDESARRRIKEMASQPRAKWRSPYRARPYKYDREVVLAFADAILALSGKQAFERGNRDKPGTMASVLVASIKWAMTSTWAIYALPTIPSPRINSEGLLRFVRKKQRTI